MMANQEAARRTNGHPAQAPDETVIVETRFGTYEFGPQNTLLLTQGLLGFPDHRAFGLANLPEPVPADFKLLQSLGEPPISFVVMPVPAEHAPLEPADADEACAALGGARESTYFLFVCTIMARPNGDGVDMTANLRAPIVFDLATRRARQCVLPSDRYPTRQPLDKWDGRV